MKLFLLLLLSILLFAGCSAELSAEKHLEIALEHLEDDDDLPLTIWHLQQYIELAPEKGGDESSKTLARLHLQKCTEKFIAANGGGTDDPKISNLELQVSLLTKQCEEQKNWISRLKAENQSLRESLLRRQKK